MRRFGSVARLSVTLGATTILAACGGGGGDNASNALADALGVPAGEALNTSSVDMTNVQTGAYDNPEIDTDRVTVSLLDDNAFRIQAPGFDERFEEDDLIDDGTIIQGVGIFQNDNGEFAFVVDPEDADLEYTTLGAWLGGGGSFGAFDPTTDTAISPGSASIVNAGAVVVGQYLGPSDLPTTGMAGYSGPAGGWLQNGATVYALTGDAFLNVNFGTGNIVTTLTLDGTSLDDFSTTLAPIILQSTNGNIDPSNGHFLGTWDPTLSSGLSGSVAGAFFGAGPGAVDTGATTGSSEAGGVWNATNGITGATAVGGFVGNEEEPVGAPGGIGAPGDVGAPGGIGAPGDVGAPGI